MAAPAATSASASPRAGVTAGRARKSAAAASRHGAATASRAQPTSSGPAPASPAASVMVAPVVPHEIAASATRRIPMSMARVVYETHSRAADGPPATELSTESHGTRRRQGMTRIGFIGVGTMGLPMADQSREEGLHRHRVRREPGGGEGGRRRRA